MILYVMLCGKLPFDDENIPNLFKKILGIFLGTFSFAEGIFALPSFLSRDAKELLARMMTVDPLKRITIPEIRESKWFQKDLPEYLQPLPEFLDQKSLQVDETIVDSLVQVRSFPLIKIENGLQQGNHS